MNFGPCKTRYGPDCPNRKVGCHSTCEKYLAFKKEKERVNAERRRNSIADEYTSDRVYAKRNVLKYTEQGRSALASGGNSQWRKYR